MKVMKMYLPGEGSLGYLGAPAKRRQLSTYQSTQTLSSSEEKQESVTPRDCCIQPSRSMATTTPLLSLS